MNYQKLYENIIQKAKSEIRKKLNKTNINYVYYEIHHIIPHCMNGGEETDNLVLLTAREHFVIHKILTLIYPKNLKILFSFSMMSKMKNKKIIYKISSRDYENGKKLHALIVSSDEYKQKKKDKWFQKHFAPEKIDDYLNSIKDSHYSSFEEPKLHISFKNKSESFNLNKEMLQQNVSYYNEQGCFVPSKF